MKVNIMTNTPPVTQYNLVPAEDGRLHTEACVEQGWWRLDWDAECRYVGVPPGGQQAAVAERVLFAGALVTLQVFNRLPRRRSR